jgi:hypothetical protein
MKIMFGRLGSSFCWPAQEARLNVANGRSTLEKIVFHNRDVSLFIMKKGTAQKLKLLSLCFSFLGTPFRHVAFIL